VVVKSTFPSIFLICSVYKHSTWKIDKNLALLEPEFQFIVMIILYQQEISIRVLRLIIQIKFRPILGRVSLNNRQMETGRF